MGKKREIDRGQPTRVDVLVGDDTSYEVTSTGSAPWLDTDSTVTYWADSVEAVEDLRTAVNAWADKYQAWDRDIGEGVG